MSAGLLFVPGVIVGAFLLLLATTWLERLAGPRFPDGSLPQSDIAVLAVIASARVTPRAPGTSIAKAQ